MGSLDDLEKRVEEVDPDNRPWVYDCSGNKVVRTKDGEPDYTKIWEPDNEELT